MKNIIVLTSFLLLNIVVLQGQNQNLSKGNIFDGEPYLAINPTNSQHIVIAWMGWVNLVEQFKIKTKTSFDGGETWSDAKALAHIANGYTSADPCIDFNSVGDVYISYIDFTGTTPPVTGAVVISKSTDDGLSWNAPFEVINTEYDGTKWPIDRPWMVIDKSSSENKDNIYLTTFNLNREQPSFNPYLSVSKDDGSSFSIRYLDTVGWLAGNFNPFPMCSPALSSNGTFYGIYPSFVLTQSLYFQSFLVSSQDGGASLDHKLVNTQEAAASALEYPDAKKGGLLLCDPTDENHLVFIFLGANFGELDVFYRETYNAGESWTEDIRINDDPLGNNRMQDMLWGDFDHDGDLVVTWRDRRNGTDSTFNTASEIWAAYKEKDATNFSTNFQITTETVAFDSILTYAGNDFMCIKLQNDTLNATWGDSRDGKLNIWFQRMTIDGTVLNTEQVFTQNTLGVEVFPNPAHAMLEIIGENIESIIIYDSSGKMYISQNNMQMLRSVQVNISELPNGLLYVQITTTEGTTTKALVKE